jgi:hypothetical protein
MTMIAMQLGQPTRLSLRFTAAQPRQGTIMVAWQGLGRGSRCQGGGSSTDKLSLSARATWGHAPRFSSGRALRRSRRHRLRPGSRERCDLDAGERWTSKAIAGSIVLAVVDEPSRRPPFLRYTDQPFAGYTAGR